MKKYIYYILMAFIIVSCNENDRTLENSELGKIPSDVPTMLHATINKEESRAVFESRSLGWDGSEMPNSRTIWADLNVSDSDGFHQYWQNGDAISYFQDTRNLKYTTTAHNEQSATFNLDNSTVSDTYEDLTVDSCYSVYPYKEDTKINKDGTVTFTFPYVQEYNEGSYANGQNGMIARNQKKSKDGINFLNFCSYLQLKIKFNFEDEISSKKIDLIRLEAINNNDFLSGRATIRFDKDQKPEVAFDHHNAINVIELNCNGLEVANKESKTFWFVLPGAFTFHEGFKFKVSFTDGSYYIKETNKVTISIKRNHITPTEELNTDKKDFSTSIIRYKYKKENSEFIFNKNETFFRDKDGHKLTPHTEKKGDEYWITFNGILHSIEQNAFENSKQMEYIIVENGSPIELKKWAFWGSKADNIKIYNNIINIGEDAFGSSNVKNIFIKGDVHNIEEKAFYQALKLASIKIEGQLFKVEKSGFSTSNVTNVEVTERIVDLGAESFADCDQLVTLILPKLEHIEDFTFAKCTALTSIDLHSIHTIGYHAFASCLKLQTVHISNQCISIKEGAFLNVGTDYWDENEEYSHIYIHATKPPKLIHDLQNKDPHIFASNIIIHIPDKSLDEYKKDSDWTYYIDNKQVVEGEFPEH